MLAALFQRGNCLKSSLLEGYLSNNQRVADGEQPAADNSVIDVQQKQPLRRRGHAGRTSITGSKHFGKPRFGPFALADLGQGAGDNAHHIVQKAIAFHFDLHEAFFRCRRRLLSPIGIIPRRTRGNDSPPTANEFFPIATRWTVKSKTVRSVDSRSEPPVSKLAKSCLPTSTTAAHCMAETSSRLNNCQA